MFGIGLGRAVRGSQLVFLRGRGGGEAADGRSPSPLRSSGTFATANGGFAALLMGSYWCGSSWVRFRFQISSF